MDANDPILIYATFPDAESAKAAASALLGARLVACANVLAPMTSVYRWDGSVETGEELPVIFKTVAGRADAAMVAIAEAHPYDTPAILKLRPEGGHPPFLEWLAEETETEAAINEGTL
ncbi:MAG: divalent-cation tolerance protein CutA [Pseudomonadota bacterium]